MDKSSKHAVRVLEYDSLLKLLKSYAKTSAAKEQISDLLPTANIVLIKKQISETSELKDLILSGNHLPLGSVENILPIITNHALSGASLEPDQLLSVASTLQTVNDIRTYSHGNRDIAPLLWLSAIDLAPQPEIISEIYRCIDSDKTVKDAATKKLLLLRRSKTKLRTTINRKLNSLINSSELKSALENKTITSRNGRPVIAMKSNFRNAVRGSLLDKSNSGFTSFIEPHVITETVNELESVRYEERKEVARILRELSVSIFAVKESLIENIRILTYIDITNAKAQFSYDYQMTAPEINDSGRLILFEARHPLLMHFIRDNFSENISPMPIEKVKSKVVSLSIKFDNKLNLIIITGPNTGGKTVALKTLGLLTLMAQSGMHIPASAGTTMPIFKKIFADIGDEQSIEQSLSTFSSHLNNIARVINNADSDTLVLLDELGSGTDPAEGAALATSILNFLHSSGTKVIATTHLGSLKTFAYSTSGAENASMEFDEKTLKPTYKLLVGQPGSSNALAIARRLGLKEEIIKHAEKLISGKENDNSKLINKVQQLRVIAERGIKESQKLSSKLKREIEEIKKERKKITEVVNAEVESIFKDVKSVVNEFSKAAVNAPPPWNKRAEEFKKRINELADGTPLARQRERFIKNLSSGKSVFVQSLNCYAIVKTINHGKKTVVVESDGVNFKISFNKILERPFSQPVKKKVKKEIKPEKKKIIKHHPAKVKNFIKNLKEGDAVYSTALSSVVIVDTINHEKKKLVVKFGGFPTELPFYKVSPVATKKDKDLAE
ncbi:MAG: hypothetical protein DRI44_03620 [Chlamydiae bacterium]|nr:MAG: hypothetical protein DRI44_03620 [Chlamydiota bacterium]